MFTQRLLAQPTAFGTQVRGMATQKQIKNRMRSVANIKKITKAMKMVSASKLRAVQRLLPAARSFLSGSFNIMPVAQAPKEINNSIVVAFTSDRGLCGAVNSSVAKFCKQAARENKGKSLKFFLFGDKARSALEREFGSYISLSVTEANKRRPASFALASVVAEKLMAMPHDELTFVYNKFISAISFKLEDFKVYSLDAMASSGNADLYDFNFDGNKADILKDLQEFRIASLVFGLNVENGTSEQSSRMNAMENSSKNAAEMLSALSLKYNKARQTKITTELIEIISGSAAME